MKWTFIWTLCLHVILKKSSFGENIDLDEMDRPNFVDLIKNGILSS